LGRIRVAAKIGAAPGATVWVAVRPEKMRIAAEKSDHDNCAAATVADIGYLGDLSIYRLKTEAGVPLQAASANIGRHGESSIGWNDKVWLSFPPEAAIVLTR
jgi:putrescine transport system ATP-binding protein